MHKYFVFIFFTLSHFAFAQDFKTTKEIDFVKEQAQVQGFSLIHFDSLKTDADTHLRLNPALFDENYTYYVVAFVENCQGCDFEMQYWNYNTKKYHAIKPTLKIHEDYLRAEYAITLSKKVEFRIELFVDQLDSVPTYVLLFKKTIIE